MKKYTFFTGIQINLRDKISDNDVCTQELNMHIKYIKHNLYKSKNKIVRSAKRE